jgi:hypothetical protein
MTSQKLVIQMFIVYPVLDVAFELCGPLLVLLANHVF